MSECKCVPRIATVPMLEAGKLNTDQWCAGYDAAPECECEAEWLLRELWALWTDKDWVRYQADYLRGHLSYATMLEEKDAHIRAYLARSKPKECQHEWKSVGESGDFATGQEYDILQCKLCGKLAYREVPQ